MILAVNVNNSYVSFGIFEDNEKCQLISTFKIAADIGKTSDEYFALVRNIFDYSKIDLSQINGAILSSVVPQLTNIISETIYKLVNVSPIKIGPGIKTGFSIKIDSPSELGADLVANAAAVVAINQANNSISKASIILDMGTVTTMFVINRLGEYIGGCIFPGIQISFDSLHGKTALLPNVTMSLPEKAIGRNSQESLRSGVVMGNAIMIDGFVTKFEKEMKCQIGEANLFATGEYAESILNACSHKFDYDSNLTLKGLFYIYQKNK